MTVLNTVLETPAPVTVDAMSDCEWERFVAADEVAMLRLHVVAGERLVSILSAMIRDLS